MLKYIARRATEMFRKWCVEPLKVSAVLEDQGGNIKEELSSNNATRPKLKRGSSL